MANGFAITISAVDNATKSLDSINKRLAQLNAPAERFNKALSKFGDTTGLSRVSEGISSLGRSAHDAFRGLDRAHEALGLMTGAASLAGIAELSRRWGQMGTQIGQLAYRLNVPVQRLSNLGNAARLAGVDAAALNSGMDTLSQHLQGAAFGRAGDAPAAALLNTLHVRFRTATGDARQADDALGDIAESIKDFNPQAQAHALDILGIGQLLPMLNHGRAGLQAFQKQAEATGGDLTQQMIKNATGMNKAWGELSLSIEGVTNDLVNEYAPALTRGIDATAKWVERNHGVIDSIGGITAGVSGLMALKPALWVLRILGLDTPATPVIGGAIAGAMATYYNGQASASGQGAAAAAGFTQVAGFDEMGMPTVFLNPTTGETRSAISFDSRFSGGGPAARAAGFSSSANANDMTAELSKFGYTREGVAALLGNGQQESGLNPLASNGSHTGIFQWSATRRAAIEAHFHKSLLSMSPTEQADAAAWEMNSNPAFADLNQQLKTSHDLRLNNYGVTTGFEAPGNYEFEVPNRLAASQAALAGMSQGHVHVDVHLHGAPTGTTAKVTTSGPVTAAPPRIEATMAMAN